MKYLTHKFKSTDGESHSIFIMREDGLSMARVYFFYDDDENGYLDMLSVDPSIMKQGEGTKLQEMREQMLRDRGYRTSCLWTLKGSWMYDWYMRRGYIEMKDHAKEVNCVWMEKLL